MNTIQELLKLNFSNLSLERNIEIKQLGKPLPNISNVINKSKKGQKEYNRHFNTELYQKYKWLCR